MHVSLQTIFDGAMVVLVIVAALATWSNSRAAKRSSEETDALTTIKIKDAAITALTAENKDLKGQIKKEGDAFNEEIAKTRERIAILERDNERLNAIVENRNPELETYMRESMKHLDTMAKGIEALLAKPTVTVNQTTTPQA